MIHIKLFEGFSTEDYYQPLENDDYYENVREMGKCFFSRKDIKYLMSLFYSTYPLYNMVVVEPRLGKKGQMYDHQLLVSKDDADFKGEMLDNVLSIVSYTTPSSIGFSIIPVEDDYFVVNIDMFSKTTRKNNNQYYLCDQMGGLMKLFKDKGIL